MRAMTITDPAGLFDYAVGMESALVGLRSRLRGIRVHAADRAVLRVLIDAAQEDIDRALGPAAPVPAHADTPERRARVDALAPVLTLAE